MKAFDVIIVGGGAAGFFAGINIGAFNPKLKVAILERGNEVLSKVKISGGGRCNVTHAEFIPEELIENYPRGQKELLGPFHTFMTGDTIEWFAQKGVELKIEDDGRMFPITNTSQTIIDCFLNEANKNDISILKRHAANSIMSKNKQWIVTTNKDTFTCSKLLIASGSSSKMWSIIEGLGHSIVKPVPSLFTFDINDNRLQDIPGVVVKDVEVNVLDSKLSSEGPLLITHTGLSAPSILKLSAFGALEFAKFNYNFEIEINFIRQSFDECMHNIKLLKTEISKKQVVSSTQFDIPKRLWKKLVEASNIDFQKRWADLNRNEIEKLAAQLTKAIFKVHGKSTFKEEFVTAGGLDLKEIHFKTYESKHHKNLYFAGEVLNIDAITGGFNFQNAWTGGFIAAKAISK